MKVLNKIKSIYLLAIVAILSFCMLLFPAMPKTASATDSSESVSITGARVILQKYGSGENVSERWATMFQAEITSYVEGSEYGMIIGPKAAYDSAVENSKANYADLVAEYAFVDKVSQTFEDDGTTKSYWAGIVYDAGALDSATLAKRASMELAAIPYVKTDDSVVLGVGGTAVPRNYLVSTHLDQQEAIQENPEAEIDGKPIEATSVAKWVGGEFNVYDGDAYICQSTNKFYVGAKGGELEEINVLANGGEVVVDNKALGADAVDSTGFKADYVSALPDFGGVDYVVYGENGATVYSAKVAERVIMRFADTKVGVAATDTTKDYLAESSTRNYIGFYKSIFYVTDAANWFADNGTEAGLTAAAQKTAGDYYAYAPAEKFDGLYVLGSNISAYTDNRAYGLHNLEFALANTNNVGNYPGLKPSSGQIRPTTMLPVAGRGFVGTFDGRGLYLDAKGQASEGIFPVAFGATIKNTAFLNLSSANNQGGIVSRATATTFENIYATVSSVSSAGSDFNDGILMTLDRCTLNNFVAEINAIDETVMTEEFVAATVGTEQTTQYYNGAKLSKIAGNSGGAHGRTTSGAFNFVNSVDAYYDEIVGKTRFIMNNPTVRTNWANNLPVELGKVWFPHTYRAATNAIIPDWAVRGDTMNFSPIATDVFTGTTGTNVYVVGSSPLYVGHDYTEAGNGATLDAKANTTIFVNEDEVVKYNKAVVDEEGNPTGETVLTDVSKSLTSAEWHLISELLDEQGNANELFAINEDTNYSLGEIILRGKQYRYGADKMATLLGTTELNVRVVNKAGWYDVADYEEMATYVNANTGAQFNADFWNVVDGVVSWKVLPA